MNRVTVTVAAVAVMGAVLSGCAEKVGGTPVTDQAAAGTVSVERGGDVITPAKLSTVACAPPKGTVSDPVCDTAPVPEKAIPSGSQITLRAGDPIRFVGGSYGLDGTPGLDRVCTVSAFVSDGTSTWALSGERCAVVKADPSTQGWKPAPGASASTVDGYKIGEVTHILYSKTWSTDGPGGLWRIPAVKLSSAVRATSDINGTSSPTAGVPVAVRGAGSGDISGYSALPARGLTWDGTGVKPAVGLGDQGAPAVQGGKLLGLTSGQSSVALPLAPTADQIVSALPLLGPSAKLLTK